mmetsp:Transcript_6060/g.11326  ORF Transcript_6060/g.11326 Transcript_6060/m.11326 type:complete len:669 (+) Transcript_6060:612-2618(+)
MSKWIPNFGMGARERRQSMSKKIPEPRPVSIFTCTWNVGNTAPDESVAFLQTARDHDLIVIGLQEATFHMTTVARRQSNTADAPERTDLCYGRVPDSLHKGSSVGLGVVSGGVVGNLMLPVLGGMIGAAVGGLAANYTSNEMTSRSYLLELCQAQLGDQFHLVASEVLLQMRMVVLVRAELRGALTEVKGKDAATGLGNVVGNKGGLAVLLRLWDTRLCFVACHLAAHQNKLEDRNENVRMILRSIRVGNKELDMHHQARHTLWMGDMNYRLDMQQPSHAEDWEAAMELMQRHKWRELMEADQLRRAMHAHILSGFQEGEVRFAPTFKLYRKLDKPKAADEHDGDAGDAPTAWTQASPFTRGLGQRLSSFGTCTPTSSQRGAAVLTAAPEAASSKGGEVTLENGKRQGYSKKRVPAYTDRVLWHSLPGTAHELQQTDYQAVPDTNTSDHTPVWASFRMFPLFQNDSKPKRKHSQVHFTCIKVHLSPEASLGVGLVDGDCSQSPMHPIKPAAPPSCEATMAYMLVLFSTDVRSEDYPMARCCSKPVLASTLEDQTVIVFGAEDLPKVALAPPLTSHLGEASRHVQLMLVARCLGSKGLKTEATFPKPKSVSYLPGVSNGVALIGQCVVPIIPKSTIADSPKELRDEFNISLCKYSQRVGLVSGDFTWSE